jgi:preprotein translocase SecE subunit
VAPSRKSSKRRRGPQPAARPRPPAKAKPPGRPADPPAEPDAVDPITIEEIDLAAGAPLQDLGTANPLPPDTSDDDPDLDPDADLEVEPLAVAPADPTRTGDDLDADDELLPAARKSRAAPAKVGGNRVAAFLRASWAELQRVQWPDRRQVGQATAVVLGFVVIAGGYLGLVDLVSQKIVDAIL